VSFADQVLLVTPYRESNEDLVNEFYGLLATARYHLRTPDALQAATAARSLATGFVTNDPAFERVEAFETLLFDKLL
jgi:predicted nucleic acid-binding protein